MLARGVKTRVVATRLLPMALALCVCVTGIGLGNWQLRRLEEKQDWIARMRERLALAPVSAADALVDPDAFAYRRVFAEGELDRDRGILLERPGPEGQRGARVLTPLRRPGEEHALLVDRGFVPAQELAAFRAGDRGALSVRVTGILRPLERETLADGPSSEPRVRWRRLRLAALERQLPYPLEAALLVRGEDTPEALPRSGWPEPTSSVPHLHYALTWYSIAGLAALFAVLVAIRGVSATRGEPDVARPGDA